MFCATCPSRCHIWFIERPPPIVNCGICSGAVSLLKTTLPISRTSDALRRVPAGSPATVARSTNWPMEDDSDSSSGAAARTATVSVTSPTSIRRSRFCDDPVVSITPARTTFLNPSISQVSSYSAGGRKGSV